MSTTNEFKIDGELLRWATVLFSVNSNNALIIGGTRVDVELEKLLCKFLRLDHVESNEIFKANQPAGSFSTKITLLSSIGLLDSRMKSIVTLIRKMRNTAAHTYKIIDLNEQSIGNQVRELKRFVAEQPLYERLKNNVVNQPRLSGADPSLFVGRQFELTLSIASVVLELGLMTIALQPYIPPTFDLRLGGEHES